MDDTGHAEILKLERVNVKRIERLERSVEEINSGLAKVLTKLERPPDTTFKWALGIILTALGSIFLILWQNDANTRSEIGEVMASMKREVLAHTEDRHPTIVQAEVGILQASLDAEKARSQKLDTQIQDSLKEVRTSIDGKIDDLHDQLRTEIQLNLTKLDALHASDMDMKSIMSSLLDYAKERQSPATQ